LREKLEAMNGATRYRLFALNPHLRDSYGSLFSGD
jgi:hypothetical protein